jgi:integrase/recombinase XerD
MSAPVITIYVRHAPGCKRAGDEFTKQCDCRKHLRWQQDGKRYRKQAGTRSWAEAEEIKRATEDQLAGRAPAKVDTKILAAACEAFLKSKKVKGISAGNLERYAVLTKRFVQFCACRNVFALGAVDLELLTDYKATWPDLYESTATRHTVQLILRVFLNFCHHSGWLLRVPKLDPIKIESPATTPLTPAEYTKLLAAPKMTKRTRAIIQLMRWSGLAVRDASCLRKRELKITGDAAHVTTERHKTGVPVRVRIPLDVAKEILKAANKEGEFLFFCGDGTELNFAKWQGQYIAWAFARANIHCEGHMVSHRLRDTFACHLLSKGVAMGDVSKALGHKSIATTENHYAQWDKTRQDRMDKVIGDTFL